MSGPIATCYRADHVRLDRLLRRAVAQASGIDAEAFGAFRSGLLRHIALEEKILLPAARRARGGAPLELARRLRVDHGALALLLVPSPSPALVAEIRSILEPHDRLEEEPGGLYEVCDELLHAEAEQLVQRAQAYPQVRVSPYQDGPRACRSAEQALRISEGQFRTGA